jgi:hypothetical protein
MHLTPVSDFESLSRLIPTTTDMDCITRMYSASYPTTPKIYDVEHDVVGCVRGKVGIPKVDFRYDSILYGPEARLTC